MLTPLNVWTVLSNVSASARIGRFSFMLKPPMRLGNDDNRYKVDIHSFKHLAPVKYMFRAIVVDIAQPKTAREAAQPLAARFAVFVVRPWFMPLVVHRLRASNTEPGQRPTWTTN